MKKINLLFTAILLLCCVGTVKAEEVTIDGIKYDVVTKEKHAIVIDGGNCSGDIVIPSEITHNNVTHSVTSIGDMAFYDCKGLTSIVIPNSVTSIGVGAFYNCSGLTSITIPNSVTSIGYYVFYDCKGLTSIVIPNSVTSIGEYAFADCSGLTSIEIPNSVTSIGNSAFIFCSGLTSIEIPNSVTSIGNYAFSSCSGLTSITIPNSVTSIGYDAFKGTAWYNNQPEGVVYAGNVLYKYKGTMLSNTSVVVKDGTLSITGGAFSSCRELTSITIPNSVTSIGEEAFDWCSGLTSIKIPNSVTSIGLGAFVDCSGLTSIEIPNSVTSIGDGAFSGCSGLTSIVVEVGNPKYDSRKNCNAIIETESNTLIAGCMNTVIPNSVTSIGLGAFADCSGLTSIEIPNSVTSIGNYAFYSCKNLTDVFCLATDVPSTSSYVFVNSYPENITLHVPAEVINSYKTTAPWSCFGNIVEITYADIIDIPAKAVLVTSNNGTINITCSLEGESVELYTSDAMFIESTTIENGCATIESGLSKGDIAIVKIGEKSIKIIID